ncbi:MAG: hypothetical protein QM516_09850, partial [Limnohabitans sp.]|nr:hypothetical protein [Limnohabitans sp.]
NRDASECTGRSPLVLIFGPTAWASQVRAAGLAPDLEVATIASVGGSWWLAARLAFRASAAIRASEVSPVFYGPRARAVFQAFRSAEAARVCVDASVSLASNPFATFSLNRARRDRLRRAWGVGQQDIVVHLLMEPITWMDARFVARAIGMAAVGGARLRLLASPKIPRIHAISSWLVGATGMPPVLLHHEAEDLALVADAVDAVVVESDGLATDPAITAGARSHHPLDALIGLDETVGYPSIFPALEAARSGIPLLVHRSYELRDDRSQTGALNDHGLNPRTPIMYFDDDVAELSCMLASLSPRSADTQDLAKNEFAKNAVAASR